MYTKYVGIVSSYDIVFDLDITPDAIFKSMNVKFTEDFTSLKEKIIQYISIVASLNVVSLIIFVNLKNYLIAEELQEVYETAFGRKIALLLIEKADYGAMGNERRCIIDSDLCIINM